MANEPDPPQTSGIPEEGADFPYVELGQSGLRRAGEHLYEEWLPDLQGGKAIRAYREMADNDSIVGAFLFAIEMLLRQMEWSAQPADDSEEAQEWADFLTGALEDMDHSWDDHIGELLSMLVFGWSWFEIVYKQRKGKQQKDRKKRSKFDDGKIGWRKFSIRSQDSLNGWVYNPNDYDELWGMRQLGPPDFQEVVIPAHKSIHYKTKSYKESPEGRSILRNCWIAYYRKKRMEAIEGIGVERDLAGLPTAYVPAEILRADATPQQKAMLQAVKTVVSTVRRDQQEGLVFPTEFDKDGNPLFRFELLSTVGTRMLDISAIITRHDQRIAMTVLADFILLGTQNVGSWALSKDKTNLFGLAISAWAQVIADAFQKQAVEPLMELNEVPEELWPTWMPGEPQSPNMEEFANFLKTTSEAGMPLFPDSELEGYVRRLFHLPEPSEDAQEMFEEQAEVKLEQAKALLEGQQLGIQQLAAQGAESPAGGQMGSGASGGAAGQQRAAQGGSEQAEDDDEDDEGYY